MLIKKNKDLKTEIIVGVGNWEMLQAASKAKADAVYFGITGINMRNFAKNFQITELKKVVDFCHKNNMKAYLTLNTIVYENELKKVEKIIIESKKANLDALIVSDFAIIQIAKKYNVAFHISTQMSISNSISAKFFENLGAERIVVARETSFKDILEIKKKTNVEIELFIHGAMCFSISGRCYLSLFLHEKSANRGECTMPCRRKWYVEGEKDKPVEIYKNTIMSAKDLNTLNIIDKLLENKFRFFKIEGRTKTPDYVYLVVKTYKKAINLWKQNKLNKKAKENLNKELNKIYNRGQSSGFYNNIPNYKDIHTANSNERTQKRIFVGIIDESFRKINVFGIKIQTEIKIGDLIEIEGKKTFVRTKIISIQKNKKDVISANKGDVGIKINERVRVKDKVFLMK